MAGGIDPLAATGTDMYRVGLISDTHDFLDPRVRDVFSGVDHILHAGDIGLPWLILQLEEVAPVTAVVGNCDSELSFRTTEFVELVSRKFLLQHQVDPRRPGDGLARRLATDSPDVVVFGHTHARFCEMLNGILFLNPGYAGKPRFKQARSVAILEIANAEVQVDFHFLPR
jgi:hypothetical protein